MSQIDYTAHNFTCYTVHECSSDDDLRNVVELIDTESNTLSQYSLDSAASTSSSIDINILRKQQNLQRKYHKKVFTSSMSPTKRVSMPIIPHNNDLLPQQDAYHFVNSPETSLQIGYFVPLAPNCFFSPPLQRRRFREKENDRNRRAVSYGGTSPNSTTLPRAAPRRVSLMKEPPPPPPKPILSQQSSIKSASTASPIPSKYPQSEYNLIQKIDSNSTLTAPSQYQTQNFYANTSTISSTSNNYSSLLCHASSTSSPLATRKREKLLHRFSDAATLGRKLKKKKNTNRTCRSMTEAIEMLADPVIEDEFFYTSRRSSFKAKQRKTVLPTQTAAVRRNGIINTVNTQARYIRAGYTPTALIRNGIIGSGEGPGANGLYQIDDRIYTTSKMFLRDGYMYPRQPGQTMDPRYPYELHEFPHQTGAAGLQLVTTPKVHISGEYLANGGSANDAGNNASLSRRNARKAAAEINYANQVYWLQKNRLDANADGRRSRSNSLGHRTAAGAVTAPNTLERNCIRNVDDLLNSLGKNVENGRGTPHSTSSHRRKKKLH
ncbi:uncharacterized protein LOC119675952 [Teleopsis dalmanni]|uniref:uncharacterized protein LOC119675952 n=1 Tax=Teleopsis dalmanni TaxID=139649 RepID=UPI0018CF9705|nr:uncharacterized protein LOC119675952 [Teleopsis dalmanni]